MFGRGVDLEEKYERFFTDGLENAGLDDRVGLLSFTLLESHDVEVELLLPDVADWKLRYQIQAVARQFEVDHGWGTVHCFFRERVLIES